MNTNTQSRTRKLTVIAMLCALSYVIMVVGRIPVLTVPPFLKYDPKDVIIVIGGFLFGPLAAFAISFIVSFFEMITVSETGWIGAVMNLVSTCAFVCPAAIIYKKAHSLKGAVVGLITGWLGMTLVMLLYNYFLTPIFLGYPRDAVAAMLVPIFLPFNLLKGGLSAGITMLLYKPVRIALEKSRLLPAASEAKPSSKINVGVMLVALFVVLSGVLLILVYQGII